MNVNTIRALADNCHPSRYNEIKEVVLPVLSDTERLLFLNTLHEQRLNELARERRVKAIESRATRGPWVVAIHFVDREYGGPEEGGWWYDTSEPSREEEHQHLVKSFEDKDEALSYMRTLGALVCKPWNEGKREVWSVIYGGDRIAAVMQGADAPHAEPVVRPHYE
jgi:hypothetical protein